MKKPSSKIEESIKGAIEVFQLTEDFDELIDKLKSTQEFDSLI